MRNHLKSIRLLIFVTCAISVTSIGLALLSLKISMESDRIWIAERKQMQSEIKRNQKETEAFANAVYRTVTGKKP